MPTFIDESGDTGAVTVGGTDYFHLAAVWVPTHEDAGRFREGTRQLRRVLGLPSDFEFKYARTHREPEQRRQFFGMATAQEFRFAVSSIDKRVGGWRKSSGSSQHWACATELAAMLRPVYCEAERGKSIPLKEPVVIDDNEDRDFLKIIKTQFRGIGSQSRPGSPMTGKVFFRSSVSDDMIQLVDMICGAVAAMIQYGDMTWYNLIADRDLDRHRLL